MAKKIIITLSLFFLPVICSAWPARVTAVKDGDTIYVNREGKTIIVGLYGIDCPEENQPYGGRAKVDVDRMIQGKIVEVELVSTDPPGSVVAIVYFNGECLNRKVVEKGLAWLDYKNCQQDICFEWNESQIRAQTGRQGLWVRPDAIPPWQWRTEEDR